MSSAKAALESDTRVIFSPSILSFCWAGTILSYQDESVVCRNVITILLGTCF